jgi:hypothetical protein
MGIPTPVGTSTQARTNRTGEFLNMVGRNEQSTDSRIESGESGLPMVAEVVSTNSGVVDRVAVDMSGT